MSTQLNVREVVASDLLLVTAYIEKAKEELFPDLTKATNPVDSFRNVYLTGGEAKFFVAVDIFGNIHGTIGMVPYNNRFCTVKYGSGKAFEVVRLYVSKEHRKFGIGRLLVEYLQNAAITAQCNVLYLHTHPFLDGAVTFWEKNGFKVIGQELIMNMITIHMEKPIGKKF